MDYTGPMLSSKQMSGQTPVVVTKAGFVLCGGLSRRMGQDKALLPLNGATLVQHMAQIVKAATGSATLVGPPERYRHLGYPVIADPQPDSGPLAGLVALLAATTAELNLVVPCDMPSLDAHFLRALLETALAHPDHQAAVPLGPNGQHPLSAVYRKNAYAPLAAALAADQRKVRDAIKALKVKEVPGTAAQLANVNTPGDWLRLAESTHA